MSVGYGRAVYFFGTGAGGFGPARLVLLPEPVVNDAAVADLDGDGAADLVVLAKHDLFLPLGYAIVVLSSPGGTFTVLPEWETGHEPQGVAAADFDGDGRVDLAVTTIDLQGLGYVSTLSLYAGLGGGAFGPARALPLDGVARGIAGADLDGDGVPDLVVAETGSPASPSGDLAVFLGAGDGAFAPGRRYPATRAPVFVAIRDMDADGALDLVTVGLAGGDVTVLRGDGSGSFAPQEAYATYLSLESMTVGDFDGDGRPDLALANQNTSFTDGKVVVIPARPPFPCLPAPGDEPGHCVQDAIDVRLVLRADLARGAGLVTWRTTHEYDALGFNLVEFDRSGNPIRLNRAPIPCVECATGGGSAYAFPVPRHQSGRDIFVELLRRSGPPRLFGPARRQ